MSWSIEPTPSLGISNLAGVSCPAASTCTAVGTDEAFPNGGTITVRWNGHIWSLQKTPTSDVGIALNAVSCPTLYTCTAVGEAPGGTTWVPVIERYSAG